MDSMNSGNALGVVSEPKILEILILRWRTHLSIFYLGHSGTLRIANH